MTFGDLPIEYDDRVLEPRAWTALQAEWAADLLEEAPPGPVLELCSGAGHIGLLAVSRQRRRLVCVDDSAAATPRATPSAISWRSARRTWATPWSRASCSRWSSQTRRGYRATRPTGT